MLEVAITAMKAAAGLPYVNEAREADAMEEGSSGGDAEPPKKDLTLA